MLSSQVSRAAGLRLVLLWPLRFAALLDESAEVVLLFCFCEAGYGCTEAAGGTLPREQQRGSHQIRVTAAVIISSQFTKTLETLKLCILTGPQIERLKHSNHGRCDVRLLEYDTIHRNWM